MKRLTSIVVTILLCSAAASVWSATTGKIQGIIRDDQSKQPVVGVSVAVVGTDLGSITDVNGEYRILNVPVGTYTLSISSVGYSSVDIINVSVSADLTTYQNTDMIASTTELGETIIVTSTRPLIIRDKVASINIITQEELRALPTRGFEQVVALQTGVVKIQTNAGQLRGLRGSRESINTPELNIRGGRPSEVAYYVDGFSQQDPLTGISTASISNNAIKEVMVISGGFPVEYGHVTSGIVNVITQSGGDKFSGTAEGVFDPEFGQKWGSFDLGGPIPGLSKGFFFGSVERRDHVDRNPSAVTADVLPGSPDKLPSNWLKGWSGLLKVDYKFSPNLSLALGGSGSRDEWQEYRHAWLFDSVHAPRYLDENLSLNAKITHTLNSSTFYNLSASYFVTERFRGDGVYQQDIWAYGRPGENRRLDNEDLFHSWDDIDSVTAKEDTTIMVDGVNRVFNVRGDEGRVWDDFLRRKSSYMGISGQITSEMNNEHTIKAGFDLQRHTLRFYQHFFPVRVYTGLSGNGFQDVNRYGYDAFGNESDDEGWENETKHPMNAAFYLQDRFEYESLIITAGLRFDYFDYKAQRLRNIELPLNPDSLPITDTLISTLEEADLQDSEKFTRFSPRLGVAFPVSDVTQMRFSYGKSYQRLELLRLYVGYDFMAYKIRTGGYYVSFGNPNLEPPKSTAYEIGISHLLSDNTVFDINLFYRDVTALVQVYNQRSQPTSFATYQNSDYGTIKGLEFQLKMRRTKNASLDLKYTLSFANGTGSYSNTTGNVAWVNGNPPKQTAPLDYDQRHTVVGIFNLRYGNSDGPKIGNSYFLENFGLNVLFNASSGLPYTPIQLINEATEGAFAPNAIDTRNARTTPWSLTIDFKAEKSFAISGYKLTPYLWVKNVLDRDNVVLVWEGSGRADVTGWLESAAGQDFVASNSSIDDTSGLDGAEKYELKQNNPQNYSNPRQILAGLRISF